MNLIWPPALDAAHSELMLRDLTGRSFSAFSGTARTVSRPGGQLLNLTLQVKSLTGQKRALLQSVLSGLRGGVGRIWCHDHSYTRRGTFPTAELVGNNTFANGTTGWDVSGTGDLVLSSADRLLRSTRATVGAGRLIRNTTSFAVTTTAAYAARVFVLEGAGAPFAGLRLGTTNGGNDVLDSATTAVGGLLYRGVVTGSTPLYYSLFDGGTDGRAVGDYQSFPYTSVTRCALVDGAAQSGAGLNVKNLPASSSGLLLQGDQVQVGAELFVVTDALNSDASGLGYLPLHRPPRVVPADDAPVIIERPMGLFMLANAETGWSSKPGGPVTKAITAATVELVEAPPT